MATTDSFYVENEKGKGQWSATVDKPAGEAWTTEPNHLDDENLQRGLKPRHISLISIGGIIGTGLFLGSGGALHNGGPLGLWLGYSIFGVILVCLMQGLGEMASYLPLAGGHLLYASRFVDPALGFALSWTYSVMWLIVNPAELSAVAVLMNYWVKDTVVNNAVWIAIAMALVFILNLFPASVYGETEFIFSSIKVITIIGLIICGIAINCGAGPHGKYIGFKYWKDPGPFAPKFAGLTGAKGQFLGFWAVLTQAAFSYLGSEVVAVTAAESKNPTRAIPRAIKQVYFRICVFYILGTFIIGLNTSSTNKALGSAGDVRASPFVIAIEAAGIKVLPHIINGALVTSAWSAANADIYIASRSLYSLAKQGWLPSIYLRTNKRGAPYIASATAATFGALAFMAAGTESAGTVFGWFCNLIAVAGLCCFTIIAYTYLQFRKAVDAQGIDRNDFPFRSSFARAGAWVNLIVIPVIIFFSGWTVFLKSDKKFDHASFITNYLPMVLTPLLWAGYKLVHKTKVIAPEEVDLHTGARLRSQFEEEDNILPTTWWGKALSVIF